MASGVDPAHVTLSTSDQSYEDVCSILMSFDTEASEPSKKKKQLNEAELALRREETARKRKHLSEKKLEDEKV